VISGGDGDGGGGGDVVVAAVVTGGTYDFPDAGNAIVTVKV